MNDKSLAIRTDYTHIVELVVRSLESKNSQRAYRDAINDFLRWYTGQGHTAISKAVVNEYRQELKAKGKSASVINQRMSAIRRLAVEAADNGLVAVEIANGIAKVKGVKSAGVRAGNWLTKDQANQLLHSFDLTSLKGLRDRAIVAVMLGAGLRRSEVAELTFAHIQQREARWVIVDLIGKGGRVRSVPIPGWVVVAIDAWAGAAGISGGKVFRGVCRYGHIMQKDSESITAQAVFYAVTDATARIFPGRDISPHDLRRTFAKLARKGGAELTQIQLTLGHSSVAVTQRYVGEDQSLTDAPCDRLGLDLAGD